MPVPITAQLEFIHSIPPDLAGMLESPCHSLGTPRPELAGCKVRVKGTTPIYVIDRCGYRRLVPFPFTFMNLFKDASVFEGLLVSSTVSDIAEGRALDENSILVRGISSETIYLLDSGTKRPISSRRIMDKYDFDERAVVVVPQVLIDAVPQGELWE